MNRLLLPAVAAGIAVLLVGAGAQLGSKPRERAGAPAGCQPAKQSRRAGPNRATRDSPVPFEDHRWGGFHPPRVKYPG